MATTAKASGVMAPQTFESAVGTLMLAGASQETAIRRVARQRPELHADWIARFNDATPAERKALELPTVRGNLIQFPDGELRPIVADAAAGVKSPAFGAMVDGGVSPYQAAEMVGGGRRPR